MVEAYNPEADIANETDSLIASVPFIHTGEDQIGWMRPEIWEYMYDILIEQGLLDASYKVEDVYTIEFLERMYGGEP